MPSPPRPLRACACLTCSNTISDDDEFLVRSSWYGAGSSGISTLLWIPSSYTAFFVRRTWTNAAMAGAWARGLYHLGGPLLDEAYVKGLEGPTTRTSPPQVTPHLGGIRITRTTRYSTHYTMTAFLLPYRSVGPH